MTAKVTLLGTGAGVGSPAFCCGCEGCKEAEHNPKAARTRCGAHIDTGGKSILIDTPPDLRSQLLREKIKNVDAIFYTHWHWDHFGGLGELEYYARLHRKSPIPVYLLTESYEDIQISYHNMCDVLKLEKLSFGERMHVEGIGITPYPARHGHTETAGFLVEGQSARFAYFPDTAGLDDAVIQKIKDVDYFICDCSFFGENIYPQSHMAMEETAELGRRVGAKKIILTHHSTHYSAAKTLVQMEEAIKPYPHVVIGYDGMKFGI